MYEVCSYVMCAALLITEGLLFKRVFVVLFAAVGLKSYINQLKTEKSEEIDNLLLQVTATVIIINKESRIWITNQTIPFKRANIDWFCSYVSCVFKLLRALK